MYPWDNRPAKTRTAYTRLWEAYCEVARVHGADPVPAQPVVLIDALLAQAARTPSYSALRQFRAAVMAMHDDMPNPFLDPNVRKTWLDLIVQTDPSIPTLAGLDGALRRTLESIDGANAQDDRDRAALLLLFDACLTRQELCSLTRDRVIIEPGKCVRLFVVARREGGAMRKIVLFPDVPGRDPVAALERWCARLPWRMGPVMCGIAKNGQLREEALHPDTLTLMVKSRTAAAGVEELTPHGLRMGRLLAGAIQGESLEQLVQRAGLREESVPAFAASLRIAKTITGTPPGVLRPTPTR